MMDRPWTCLCPTDIADNKSVGQVLSDHKSDGHGQEAVRSPSDRCPPLHITQAKSQYKSQPMNIQHRHLCHNHLLLRCCLPLQSFFYLIILHSRVGGSSPSPFPLPRRLRSRASVLPRAPLRALPPRQLLLECFDGLVDELPVWRRVPSRPEAGVALEARPGVELEARQLSSGRCAAVGASAAPSFLHLRFSCNTEDDVLVDLRSR